MEDKNRPDETENPIVLHQERRNRNQKELSCEEIMKIVRKRGAKCRNCFDAE